MSSLLPFRSKAAFDGTSKSTLKGTSIEEFDRAILQANFRVIEQVLVRNIVRNIVRFIVRLNVCMLCFWQGLAPAQEKTVCSAVCESSRKQCKAGDVRLDGPSVATLAGALTIALATARPPGNTDLPALKSNDPTGRQQERALRQEQEEQCRRSYFQCLDTCQPKATDNQ